MMGDVSWVEVEWLERGRDMLAEKSGDVKSVGEKSLRCGGGGRVSEPDAAAFVAERRIAGACKVAVMGRKRIHG